LGASRVSEMRLGASWEDDTIVRLQTWARRSQFEYTGSVEAGVLIRYGRSGQEVRVSREQFATLLRHFHGRAVSIGTSRTIPPAGSVGEWLQKHVTKTAIASYVGPILIHEGYAEKGQEPSEIHFALA